jgi:hypothetical protein
MSLICIPRSLINVLATPLKVRGAIVEDKIQILVNLNGYNKGARNGGNVGDSANIPLPKWVVEEIDRAKDLAYKDKSGKQNYEYISLGCDNLPVLKGRTSVQCYVDYMRSFKERFKDLLGETIVEIQVGMGPVGELQYPSYPESNGTWDYLQVKVHACVGGSSVLDDQRILMSGVHVVVGTPGRVFDMLHRHPFCPDYINMLVLDEADEMLSSGLKNQIYDIFQLRPSKIHVGVFSVVVLQRLSRYEEEESLPKLLTWRIHVIFHR